ncbi:hypothetical protein AURDEDRAFT_126965 [Auricularia subglabra TFB-10046 SS5]|nr:hypothetical protein AURDEDRAFT_126965 [Auricularia subglabra TFB-10046 SS5]
MRSGSPLFVKIDSAFLPTLEGSSSDEFTDSASPSTPEDKESLSWPEDAVPVATLPAITRVKAPTFIRSAPIIIPEPASKRLPGRSPLGTAKPLLPEDFAPTKPEVVARPARVLQVICDERREAAIVHLEKFVVRRSKVAPQANWESMKAPLPVEQHEPVIRIKARPRVHPTEAPLARRTVGMARLERKYQELMMMRLFNF